MGDLEVDTTMLRTTGRALRFVATELESAESIADGYAAVVGHARLADRMREFGSNWENNHKDIIESIGGLADLSTGAGEAAEQIERELKATLTGTA